VSEYFASEIAFFQEIFAIFGEIWGLTQVALSYDGYICVRLTVRPQHQAVWGIPEFPIGFKDALASVQLLLIARKLNVATCLPGYYKFLTMQADGIWKILHSSLKVGKMSRFMISCVGILQKPVEKINWYEIQWLRYFAFIINKISNFITKQASFNRNCFVFKCIGRPLIPSSGIQFNFCNAV